MRSGDLTKGPITRRLLLFALPLLLGSLVQQLYNTVDLIFAGNLIGTQASAAIGASSLLITCLVGFFGGMSVGSGVIIAQVFGAQDSDRLSKALHNSVALSIAGGAILMVSGLLLAPWFLETISTPADIIDDGVLYLRVYAVSFFPVIAYNLGAGALRALGDSKHPLYAQVVGGLANVALDYLLLVTLNMGIAGIALAQKVQAEALSSNQYIYIMRPITYTYVNSNVTTSETVFGVNKTVGQYLWAIDKTN